MKRTIICEVEVDDEVAQKEIDDGPVAYLEREFGWLEQSGIALNRAVLLDDDSDLSRERYALEAIRNLMDGAHEEGDSVYCDDVTGIIGQMFASDVSALPQDAVMHLQEAYLACAKALDKT